MVTEKRGFYCVFKPEKLPSTEEMRGLFQTSYPVFLDMALMNSPLLRMIQTMRWLASEAILRNSLDTE